MAERPESVSECNEEILTRGSRENHYIVFTGDTDIDIGLFNSKAENYN